MNPNTNSQQPIAVLGAGAWGTALAILLARNGQTVRLWDYDPKKISTLYHARSNQDYLPDISFPDSLQLYADLADTLAPVEDVLIVVPSNGFREMLKKIKALNPARLRLVWGTKGLDPQSGKLLHEVVQEVFGKVSMAILAGPSFAKEVALGLPTAVTIASNDNVFLENLMARFHNPVFRVYKSNDLIGVQICGAVKNVLALAVGTSDGLGFGANARCALITRGIAEMTRVGTVMGGKAETFVGLAGLGDLVLTATDDQSRNRRFGVALGNGKSIAQARKEISQVVEGVDNAANVFKLAKSLNVEMPILAQVYHILHDKQTPLEAMKALLSRDPKQEDERKLF